jgi:hypothetical protein
MSIPKVIVQTSRIFPYEYAVNMIRDKSPGWTYEHYIDKDIIQFFIDYPLDEFPDVAQKFYSFNHGEHRADLFRYYYLYIKGGVYMDLDAMIKDNIENIVQDYEFVSVNSSYFPNTIFQGFLGCTPKHPIIYEALKDIYSIDRLQLLHVFHTVCTNMYRIVETYKTLHVDSKIKLFEEITGVPEKEAHTIDPERNNMLILIHYYGGNKRIPQN